MVLEKENGEYMLGLARLDISIQIPHRPGDYDLDRIVSRVAGVYVIVVDDISL